MQARTAAGRGAARHREARNLGLTQLEIPAHGLGHAQLERVGYERVTDRYLVDGAGLAQKRRQVLQAQVVAGVDAQPDFTRASRSAVPL